MKMIEPYSPTPRAKAREPGEHRRDQRRQHHPGQGPEPGGAQGGGGLLDLLVDLGDQRLHGSHREGQPDEHHGDEDPHRRIGRLDTEPGERRAEQTVRRIERGQRDAGHRGRQREGQIHGRIHELAAREAVAGQNPGDQEAEDRGGERRDRRHAEAQPQGAGNARIGGDVPDPRDPEAGRLGDKPGERQQHDEPEAGQRVAEAEPEARDHARTAEGAFATRRLDHDSRLSGRPGSTGRTGRRRRSSASGSRPRSPACPRS